MAGTSEMTGANKRERDLLFILAHGSDPEKIAKALCGSRSDQRRLLAAQLAKSEEVLLLLAGDKSAKIRAAAGGNPAGGKAVLEKVARAGGLEGLAAAWDARLDDEESAMLTSTWLRSEVKSRRENWPDMGCLIKKPETAEQVARRARSKRVAQLSMALPPGSCAFDAAAAEVAVRIKGWNEGAGEHTGEDLYWILIAGGRLGLFGKVAPKKAKSGLLAWWKDGVVEDGDEKLRTQIRILSQECAGTAAGTGLERLGEGRDGAVAARLLRNPLWPTANKIDDLRGGKAALYSAEEVAELAEAFKGNEEALEALATAAAKHIVHRMEARSALEWADQKNGSLTRKIFEASPQSAKIAVQLGSDRAVMTILSQEGVPFEAVLAAPLETAARHYRNKEALQTWWEESVPDGRSEQALLLAIDTGVAAENIPLLAVELWEGK